MAIVCVSPRGVRVFFEKIKRFDEKDRCTMSNFVQIRENCLIQIIETSDYYGTRFGQREMRNIYIYRSYESLEMDRYK